MKIEAIIRAFLFGSAVLEYQKDGTICGIPVSPGMKIGEKFPSPIFTPTTKAPLGEHDKNITFEQMIEIVGGGPEGRQTAEWVRENSFRIFARASTHALKCGILLFDTKP